MDFMFFSHHIIYCNYNWNCTECTLNNKLIETTVLNEESFT